MQYRLLGRSGLKVSAMTMGTMTFTHASESPVGAVGLEEARRQIDLCLDHGVNMIDTANLYSSGDSEDIIGQALAGKRNDVLLATKARLPVGHGPNDRGSSRHHLIASCEASLRRLRTDHVELFMLHQWDGETPLEETLAALDHLVSSGKVQYIGCSNFSGWHIMKALGVAERLGLPRFVAQQIHYTLQAREAEYELVPISISEGLGIMVWSPIAGGLLSGKFRRGERGPEGARHTLGRSDPPIRDEDALFDVVDAIVAIAEARGVSGAQVALAWLLGRPGVATVVIGGRTEAQFKDSLAAIDLELTAGERQALDRVSEPPLLYPYWHQFKWARDRLSAADRALLGPYLLAEQAESEPQ
jgi:aryl-alcohol dehydrogenase-like predicted oxidoreductase